MSKRLPEALGEYAAREATRFHMPGHKGFGLHIPPSWDVTEIEGMDDLHGPTGPIRDTEEAYMRAYGAKACFLLINGSTAGNLAMLLSLGENGRILLSPNAHRSVFAGLALGGHSVIPLHETSPAAVDEALSRDKADAVFLVSPDYYGRCADLRGIAAAAHAHGAKLLVDAAHGAHFPFSEALPDLCTDCVDMWTVSAHKTLNAMTQSAVLCLGETCDIEAMTVRRMLSLVESSSPSYPLMASLDWALHSAYGAWDAHVARIHALRVRIAAINGLTVLENDDPTRLVIDVRGRGITGPAALQSLLSMDVVPEMADFGQLILITTPSDLPEWYDKLLIALERLPYSPIEIQEPQAPMHTREQVLSLRKAMLAPAEPVPLMESAGRIVALPAGLYPPGTPLLFPGTRIASEDLTYIKCMANEGLSLFGVHAGCVICVKERIEFALQDDIL